MVKIEDISIIILNYNTAAYLKSCLNSISEILSEIDLEVIVVDNNSPNRDIEKIPIEFPDFQYHFRKVNDGFAGGCNYGAKYCKGKFLIFINPDVNVKKNSIAGVINFLKSSPEAGIVSGLFIDENGNLIYSFNEFPSVSWEFFHLIGFGYDQKINKLLNKPEILENNAFDVDWIPGAFFAIRKSDFEIINGFDESYFIYYEDVDICFKVKKLLNKKIICIPDLKIEHSSNSSIKEEINDNLYFFNMHRGKLLFIKNYTFVKRIIIKLIGFISILLRMIYLPFWKKYLKSAKKEKFKQLKKILKLYTNDNYLNSSKYEYVSSK